MEEAAFEEATPTRIRRTHHPRTPTRISRAGKLTLTGGVTIRVPGLSELCNGGGWLGRLRARLETLATEEGRQIRKPTAPPCDRPSKLLTVGGPLVTLTQELSVIVICHRKP